ncbi:MAG: nucleotidyltransferase family protein [Bacteroidales bacterium]|nr:nucleotidyltransferase family protein [Bacteroidales bacterium]
MQPYLPPEHQLLISLAKSEIWPEAFLGQNSFLLSNEQINSCLADLEPSGWNHLFLLAAQQGLLAIVWDALQKLMGEGLSGQGFSGQGLKGQGLKGQGLTGRNVTGQEETGLGIPRALKIRWELSVRHIGEIHRRQRLVLKELAEVFAREGIRVMLLKGLGLAEMYPRPEHRESGDLDIYLFGDFEKGNKVIGDLGIEVEYDGTKHSKFYYKGIPVENHRNFLNVSYTRVDKILEEHLSQILSESDNWKLLAEESKGAAVLVPPVDFHFLFLVRHTVTHFLSSGIVLRHLYDFGIFLSRYEDQIDFPRLEPVLKESGQFRLYEIFLNVAHIYLGMPALKRNLPLEQVYDEVMKLHAVTEARIRNGDLPLEWEYGEVLQVERVILDILDNPWDRRYIDRVMTKSLPVRKFYGAVRMFRSRWKYDLAEKHAFRRRFHGAVKNAVQLFFRKNQQYI